QHHLVRVESSVLLLKIVPSSIETFGSNLSMKLLVSLRPVLLCCGHGHAYPPSNLRVALRSESRDNNPENSCPRGWVSFFAILGGRLLDYSSDFEIKERRVSGLYILVLGRAT